MFMARDFAVRDEDTIYVTEAPFAQWSRAISMLVTPVTSVGTLATTANTLSGN